VQILQTGRGYNHEMEYEESYQGRRIIVTTKQGIAGAWTSGAELLDAGRRVFLAGGSEDTYASEEEARRAALSAAAATIDRARASRGKP
jgi:hypothetical protein